MTATASRWTENTAVKELTDKAIDNEIRKYERMIVARKATIADLHQEVAKYETLRATLIEHKIERLKAQLPEQE